MEGQCRLGLFRAADDLRGQRQAIPGDRVGAEQRSQDQAHQHARTQGSAPRDRALCLRALTGATLPDGGMPYRGGGRIMTAKCNRALRQAALAGVLPFVGAIVMAASTASAAEVTPDRLVNADKEPQNWLMNHRTYDGQRYSPLGRINKDNVKNLRLAYAVPLSGIFRRRLAAHLRLLRAAMRSRHLQNGRLLTFAQLGQ